MGEKSIQKKQYILEKAREVFVQKGFRDVTMKDIVEVCDISRGGLYLYYDSTESIFKDVLQMEESKNDDKLAKEFANGSSVSDIMAVFLKAQRTEILSKKPSLTVATYEYCFKIKGSKEEVKHNRVKKQFDMAVKIVEKLIEAGVENGEFVCEYPLLAARNMMYAIEGMRVIAQTTKQSSDAVDKEIAFLLGGIVAEA